MFSHARLGLITITRLRPLSFVIRLLFAALLVFLFLAGREFKFFFQKINQKVAEDCLLIERKYSDLLKVAFIRGRNSFVL